MKSVRFLSLSAVRSLCSIFCRQEAIVNAHVIWTKLFNQLSLELEACGFNSQSTNLAFRANFSGFTSDLALFLQRESGPRRDGRAREIRAVPSPPPHLSCSVPFLTQFLGRLCSLSVKFSFSLLCSKFKTENTFWKWPKNAMCQSVYRSVCPSISYCFVKTTNQCNANPMLCESARIMKKAPVSLDLLTGKRITDTGSNWPHNAPYSVCWEMLARFRVSIYDKIVYMHAIFFDFRKLGTNFNALPSWLLLFVLSQRNGQAKHAYFWKVTKETNASICPPISISRSVSLTHHALAPNHTTNLNQTWWENEPLANKDLLKQQFQHKMQFTTTAHAFLWHQIIETPKVKITLAWFSAQKLGQSFSLFVVPFSAKNYNRLLI